MRLIDDRNQSAAFVGNSSGLTVRWDAFTVKCAGLRSYAVSLLALDDSIVWESEKLAIDTYSLTIPPLRMWALVHGTTYVVSVKAENLAGNCKGVTRPLPGELPGDRGILQSDRVSGGNSIDKWGCQVGCQV